MAESSRSDNGDRFWSTPGRPPGGIPALHREDGPAVELTDGSKTWWLAGELVAYDFGDGRVGSSTRVVPLGAAP